MRRIRQTILLTMAFVLSIAIYTAQASDEFKLTGKVNNETRTKEFNLSVSPSCKKARLRIKNHIESGKVVWTLRDPSGKSWIAAETSKQEFSLDSGKLDVIPGTWTLQAEFKNATLEYEIHWSTR